MIYFVTVNYYSAEAIANLRRSIQQQENIPYQLIVVNNSPDDSSILGLYGESTVILDVGDNIGFGAGCNVGLRWVYQQDPEAIVWLINPDALLRRGILDKAPDLLEFHPEVSILGTIIYDPTGNIWFAGGVFVPETGGILEKNLLDARPELPYVSSDWVTGCSLLINLKNFQECPYFDPDYFLYYEDFDFCRRYATLGHVIGVTNRLSVIHYPSSIVNKDIKNKFKHSTYSYLLTMEKYSHKNVRLWRWSRLTLHAVVLLFVKPRVAIGKFEGVWSYLRRSPRIHGVLSQIRRFKVRCRFLC